MYKMDRVMKQYPSTDLKQNLGDVRAAASQQPVSITRHNKPRYVLMSIEAYEARFANDSRRAYAAKDAPSAARKKGRGRTDGGANP